ncbi:DDE-type integrase/transposase/recombinase [bacterium]|nr:DDE-type integrase/transposase/recombinase [bacterium]
MELSGYRSTFFAAPSTSDNSSANLLEQRFEVQRPNQVWQTDITYIQTKEGYTYLWTVEDLYSRRIVGWATGRKIDAELAQRAFLQAVALRSSLQGLIVHSDRGSQFASSAFREGLRRCG